MSLRVLSSGVVALGLALLTVSTAPAQFPGNRRQQPQMDPIKTGGMLVLAGQDRLQLSTNTNQKILVMVRPDTEVSVTGTAELDYLKAGVVVEFVAEVDKLHKVKDEIIKMTVITPTAERPLGLSAPTFDAPEKKGEKNEKAKPPAPDPGIGPPAKGRKGDADPLSGDPLASKPAKGRGSAPQFPGTFTVRGTIKMCKDGNIKLSAGRTSIQGKLKDDVVINVDMSDFHAAQPDDRVTVDGFNTKAAPNLVFAKSIAIKLANPLTGPKKHGPHAKPKKKAAGGDDPLSPGK